MTARKKLIALLKSVICFILGLQTNNYTYSLQEMKGLHIYIDSVLSIGLRILNERKGTGHCGT